MSPVPLTPVVEAGEPRQRGSSARQCPECDSELCECLVEPWEDLRVPGASVRYCQRFFRPDEADDVFERLLKEVSWRQDSIQLYGKTHELPRLQQWFGDPGSRYVYSGIKLSPLPWTPLIEAIRNRVQVQTRERFNSVLLNQYRDGEDSVGWHADDEPQLGKRPVIASVSLGAEREFLFRNNDDRSVSKVMLHHGSLLLMRGRTQETHQHSLPKRKNVKSLRVNLTFRCVVP